MKEIIEMINGLLVGIGAATTGIAALLSVLQKRKRKRPKK